MHNDLHNLYRQTLLLKFFCGWKKRKRFFRVEIATKGGAPFCEGSNYHNYTIYDLVFRNCKSLDKSHCGFFSIPSFDGCQSSPYENKLQFFCLFCSQSVMMRWRRSVFTTTASLIENVLLPKFIVIISGSGCWWRQSTGIFYSRSQLIWKIWHNYNNRRQ